MGDWSGAYEKAKRMVDGMSLDDKVRFAQQALRSFVLWTNTYDRSNSQLV